MTLYMIRVMDNRWKDKKKPWVLGWVLVSAESAGQFSPSDLREREFNTWSAFWIRDSILLSKRRRKAKTHRHTHFGLVLHQWFSLHILYTCVGGYCFFPFLPRKSVSMTCELFLSVASREICSANWSLRSLRVCWLSTWQYTQYINNNNSNNYPLIQ